MASFMTSDDGTGNSLFVSVTQGSLQVVPEPGTASLIALGLLAVAATSRRMSSQATPSGGV